MKQFIVTLLPITRDLGGWKMQDRPWCSSRRLLLAACVVATAAVAGTATAKSALTLTAKKPPKKPPVTLLQSSYKPTAGKFGGTLTYGAFGNLSSLNIYSTNAITVANAGAAIWSKLWTFAPDNRPIPVLVTQVPTVENGLVKKIGATRMDEVIKLRPGLKWSDGSPLTTSDVAFTLSAICSGKTSLPTAVGFDHIASWTIKSATEMTLHFGPNKAGKCGLTHDLTTGIVGGYLTLTFAPMPKAVLGDIPVTSWPQSSYFTKKPTVTSGPYVVDSFSPGSAGTVVFSPNPFYSSGRTTGVFGHKPYLNRLIYQIYPDKSSLINALNSGAADIGIGLSPPDASALTKRAGMKLVAGFPGAESDLWFNTSNNTTGCGSSQFAQSCGKPTPWKHDPAVRRALSLAVDRNQIIATTTGGFGKVQASFIPNSSPWYNQNLKKPVFNTTAAAALLQSDGWKLGGDGIRVKNGKKLSFTISTGTGDPLGQAVEEQLKASWSKIGAQVTSFVNVPTAQLFGDFAEGGIQSTGQFDIVLSSSTHTPDPNGWQFYAEASQIPSPTNPGGGNRGYWDDAKLASLLDQGNLTLDSKKRKAVYDAAQEEFVNYSGMIILYAAPVTAARAWNVGNFNPGGPYPGFQAWNLPDWFLTNS